MRYLIACLVLACGSPPVITPQDRLYGDYNGSFIIKESVGSCDFLTNYLAGNLSFDGNGNVKPPLPGITCETSYPLHIHCEGYGSTLDATGNIRNNYAWGTGEAKGNVGGCEYVRFYFNLKSKS